jgi:hypothetical protein
MPRRISPIAHGLRRAPGRSPFGHLITGALVVTAALATALAQDGERTLPIDITHSVRDADAPVAGAVFGSSGLNPDVLVANSGDGGKTWASVRVAAGSGTWNSVGEFLDKEYTALAY